MLKHFAIFFLELLFTKQPAVAAPSPASELPDLNFPECTMVALRPLFYGDGRCTTAGAGASIYQLFLHRRDALRGVFHRTGLFSNPHFSPFWGKMCDFGESYPKNGKASERPAASMTQAQKRWFPVPVPVTRFYVGLSTAPFLCGFACCGDDCAVMSPPTALSCSRCDSRHDLSPPTASSSPSSLVSSHFVPFVSALGPISLDAKQTRARKVYYQKMEQ